VKIPALVPGGDQQLHIDIAIDTNTWTFPAELLHNEWPLRARGLATVYYCFSEGACLTHAGSANRSIFVIQILKCFGLALHKELKMLQVRTV
jgi:L-ascorbate metabolism protein UlaG (beta-lactamase superfamily)